MITAKHDCFGSVLVVEGGKVTFICAECEKPCAELDDSGLRLENRHSGKRHTNVIALKALKIAVARVEKKG